MKTVRIRIGGKMFVLREGQDVDTLKRDVVAAARSGADFLDFETAEGIAVSALITPHVVVRIWAIEQADDAAANNSHPYVREHKLPEANGTHFDH